MFSNITSDGLKIQMKSDTLCRQIRNEVFSEAHKDAKSIKVKE